MPSPEVGLLRWCCAERTVAVCAARQGEAAGTSRAMGKFVVRLCRGRRAFSILVGRAPDGASHSMENIVEILSALAAVAASVGRGGACGGARDINDPAAHLLRDGAGAGRRGPAGSRAARAVCAAVGQGVGRGAHGRMSYGAPADWTRVIEDPAIRKALVSTYS